MQFLVKFPPSAIVRSIVFEIILFDNLKLLICGQDCLHVIAITLSVGDGSCFPLGISIDTAGGDLTHHTLSHCIAPKWSIFYRLAPPFRRFQWFYLDFFFKQWIYMPLKTRFISFNLVNTFFMVTCLQSFLLRDCTMDSVIEQKAWKIVNMCSF